MTEPAAQGELVHALLHAVDRAVMLRLHLKAALSTARARQLGSADPDAFVEVITLLEMALEDDDRFTVVNDTDGRPG